MENRLWNTNQWYNHATICGMTVQRQIEFCLAVAPTIASASQALGSSATAQCMEEAPF